MGNPAWRFEGNERKYIEEVLSTGFRAGADGAFTTRFEQYWAAMHGAPFAVAFNSGTSTLHAAVLALGCGPGDEVLVPALTPLMCGLAPHYTGAIPVYVDSDPDTFLMDPADLERKITERSRAIMVVHMYGGVCDMSAILAVAKRHGLPVIEDCAQCVLGRDPKGRITGASGAVGSWSFENSKQLTSGDGGIVVCHDEALAARIRKIGGLGFKTLTAAAGRVRVDRSMFQDPNWERFELIGYNYRLNQLAAAVALAQAERAQYFVGLRRAMGEGYRAVLRRSKLLRPQAQPPGYIYTYYTFSAKFCGAEHGVSWYDLRAKHMEFGGDGIFAAAKLLYQEPAFRDRKIGRGTTPVAEDLQRRLMNFTTNQPTAQDRNIQLEALSKALRFFGDKDSAWEEVESPGSDSISPARVL